MSNRKKDKPSQIYIVDDHAVVRDGLKTLIGQEPNLAVCGEAATPAEALAGLAELKPDLLLVDISLQESSGLELLKDLAIRYPDTPVIILSMHDEMVYAERAVRAGARGYVMKSESSDRIISAIHTVLAGKVFLSDRVMTAIADRLGTGRSERQPVERLSDRELQVFEMMGQGISTAEIAERLHVSLKTVQMYVARAKEKFGVSSSRELMREAVRWDKGVK